MDTPRIYVGTYNKYNSGSIAGQWLDLEDYVDSSDFYEACAKLHSNEADPEYMFQDYEGFPAGLYCESGNIDAIYEFIELEDFEREIVEVYLDYETGSTEDYSRIVERYQGQYDSLSDYAYEYCESTGCLNDVPELVSYHIDYESMGRDLCANMTEINVNGSIWLFDNS